MAKQTQVELAEKATLNALMNVHVKSKAEQEAREELDHAIAAVRTLYKHGILEERAETGAAVTPRRKFFIAVGAVRQLVRLVLPMSATVRGTLTSSASQAGILRSHEGLHALRKTMDDEWYAKVLVKRPAKRELIETEATFCHGASSPHFDDGAPEYQTNVIDPDSSFRRVWDGTQVLFLVYVSLFVPYRVCFRDAPVPWRWDFCIDIFVDVFFAVDVCLSFVTGYVRHIDGKTEYESSKVKRHYLKSWFLVDFLSIIPINYIVIIAGAESNAESGSKTRAVRMLRFAKLLKLLRLVRMKRILDRYEALLGVLHSTSSTIVSIAKLTVAVSLHHTDASGGLCCLAAPMLCFSDRQIPADILCRTHPLVLLVPRGRRRTRSRRYSDTGWLDHSDRNAVGRQRHQIRPVPDVTLLGNDNDDYRRLW